MDITDIYVNVPNRDNEITDLHPANDQYIVDELAVVLKYAFLDMRPCLEWGIDVSDLIKNMWADDHPGGMAAIMAWCMDSDIPHTIRTTTVGESSVIIRLVFQNKADMAFYKLRWGDVDE